MPNSAQDYLDSCLFFTVKKLNRALDRLTENAFQKVGLNPSYTSILLILSHENGKIQKDLAKMLGLQPQTIRKWISQDRLPHNLVKPKKQGNRNVWHIDKVMHYLQSIKN